MKTMYSNKYHVGAYQYDDGIWAIPVHTSEQKKMRAAGWVYRISDLENIDTDEIQEDLDGDGKVDRYDDALELGIDIYDTDGNKLHWRKIDKLIEEKLAEE